METTSLGKILTIIGALTTFLIGVVLLAGPVLIEPVFSEPLWTSSHITSVKFYTGGGGCIDPVTGYYVC